MTASSSRMLTVLTALGSSEEPLTVSRLGDATGINRVSMGRLLISLAEDGLVACDELGRYSLTLGILGPGLQALAGRRVREAAFPLLVDLSSAVGHEVSLGFFEFPRIVFVETIFVVGGRVSSRLIYTPRPLLESHTGRLLASYASAATVDELFRSISELDLPGEHTEAFLRSELVRARADGYLVFDRNVETGSPAGLSVPIFDESETASAGIVITRPTGLDQVFQHEALPKALDTARRISAALGSRRRSSVGNI
jgi:DNA-binding IclR family transcriptional regulator